MLAHAATGLLTNPLHEAWLAAGREAGYPLTDDMNGFQQEGFGRMDMTVGGGRRCSAANAYLRPAMSRKQSDGAHPCAGDPDSFRAAGAPPAFATGAAMRTRSRARGAK